MKALLNLLSALVWSCLLSAPSMAATKTATPQMPTTTNAKSGTSLVIVASTLTDARFESTSTVPQYVLHTPLFQASRLRLFDAAGIELVPTDERAREKFDPTVTREMYQVLPHNTKLALFQPHIVQRGDVYELAWGPFSFVLGNGSYDAFLEWESVRSDYVDEAGKSHKLDGVWLGTLRSPRFKVQIP